jgi:hypothetical protein
MAKQTQQRLYFLPQSFLSLSFFLSFFHLSNYKTKETFSSGPLSIVGSNGKTGLAISRTKSNHSKLLVEQLVMVGLLTKICCVFY